MLIKILNRVPGAQTLLVIIGVVLASFCGGLALGETTRTETFDDRDVIVIVRGTEYMNYPEWELLPQWDFEDERVIAELQQLIDEGEAAHEAMLAVVRDCNNLTATSCALSVLRKTKGDKRQVVAELKKSSRRGCQRPATLPKCSW